MESRQSIPIFKVLHEDSTTNMDYLLEAIKKVDVNRPKSLGEQYVERFGQSFPIDYVDQSRINQIMQECLDKNEPYKFNIKMK